MDSQETSAFTSVSVPRRCPGLVTGYVTFARRSKGPVHSYYVFFIPCTRFVKHFLVENKNISDLLVTIMYAECYTSASVVHVRISTMKYKISFKLQVTAVLMTVIKHCAKELTDKQNCLSIWVTISVPFCDSLMFFCESE